MAAAPTGEATAPITGEYSWEKLYENYDDAKRTITGRIKELQSDITRQTLAHSAAAAGRVQAHDDRLIADFDKSIEDRDKEEISVEDEDRLIADFDKAIEDRAKEDRAKEEIYCCEEALRKLEKLFTEEKNTRLAMEEYYRESALLKLNKLESDAKRTGKLGGTEEVSQQYYDALERIDNIDQIVTDRINKFYNKKLDFRGFCKKINSEIDDLTRDYQKVGFVDFAVEDTSAPTPKKPRGLGRIFGKTRKGGKSRRKYKNKKKTRKGNKKRRVKTRKGRKAKKGRKTRKR